MSFFSTLSGKDGEITVVGLGAVVGTFHSWTLTRPADDARGNPGWTLRAVLSWSNETMLKSEILDKRIILRLNSEKKIELCGYESMILENGINMILEGVTQCQ
jgi:hypothetical protein